MVADLKVITGANLFCDEDPGESNHLQLSSVGLPDFNRTLETHMPGGGHMGLEIDMNMLEALTMPFALVGINVGMLQRVGYGDSKIHNYTLFKEIRNVLTNEKERLTAVVRGFIGTVNQDAYEKNLSAFNYEIHGIQSYRLTLGARLIYDFDFASNRRIVGSSDENAETNSILGIV